MALDEPHVSVGGMLGLGKDKNNLVRILPKYEKSQFPRMKRSCDRSSRKKKEGQGRKNSKERRCDREGTEADK